MHRHYRRFQVRSNRKRRKRIFGMIRTSRSHHPSDVSQRKPSTVDCPAFLRKQTKSKAASGTDGVSPAALSVSRHSNRPMVSSQILGRRMGFPAPVEPM
ncbi:unnamed protein product [Sphagnum balticum]